MKYCPNCGCGNDETSSACSNCGAVLNTAATVTRRRRNRGGQNIVKIVVAIAAVAVVAGGIFAGTKLFGGNTFSKAYKRTTGAITEEVNGQKDISAVAKQLEKYEQQGKYTLDIGYQNSELSVNMQCDYSRGDKLMDGVIHYSDAQMDLDLDYSVKRGVVQFTIPGVVQDVYGFSVNKLGNKLGKSPVGKLLPIDFTALSDADFFQKTNIAKSLNKLTKGKFDALKDSVKIKYLDKRTLSFPSGSQPCKMYQVTWNEQALNDLLKSMTGNPVLSKLAGFIKDIIPQIDGDCRCYINEDGYLVGVDLVSLGSKYFFVMEGETNPWDQFSLTVTSLYGDTKVYTGGLSNTNQGMRLYLQNQDELFFEAEYNNDGSFSVYTDKFGTIVYGNLTVSNGCVNLEANLNSTMMGPQKLTCKVSALAGKPEQLTKYYVDLLDMSLADWQRLLLDMGISVSNLG